MSARVVNAEAGNQIQFPLGYMIETSTRVGSGGVIFGDVAYEEGSESSEHDSFEESWAHAEESQSLEQVSD